MLLVAPEPARSSRMVKVAEPALTVFAEALRTAATGEIATSFVVGLLDAPQPASPRAPARTTAVTAVVRVGRMSPPRAVRSGGASIVRGERAARRESAPSHPDGRG